MDDDLTEEQIEAFGRLLYYMYNPISTAKIIHKLMPVQPLEGPIGLVYYLKALPNDSQ